MTSDTTTREVGGKDERCCTSECYEVSVMGSWGHVGKANSILTGGR